MVERAVRIDLQNKTLLLFDTFRGKKQRKLYTFPPKIEIDKFYLVFQNDSFVVSRILVNLTSQFLNHQFINYLKQKNDVLHWHKRPVNNNNYYIIIIIQSRDQ